MRSSTLLLDLIAKMQPIEFAGLARLLGVKIVDGEPATPRPFTDVLEDVMKKFEAQNRTRKREILRLVKKANAAHKGGND